MFASRPLDSLSGGQRQRAWIAMNLALGTDILLLDERTTYLNLSHELEVLHLVLLYLVRRLNEQEGNNRLDVR